MNQAARRGREAGTNAAANDEAAVPGKRTQIGELPIARRVEAVTGADLGGVSIHADGAAADEAKGQGARAFARGQDVYFGAGELRPNTPDGDFLIAHELAHTVQQRGGASMQLFAIASGSAPDQAEREANEIAHRAVGGGEAMAVTASPAGVAKFTNDDQKGCASQQAEAKISPDRDGDGWDDQYQSKKTYTGLSIDQYEGMVGQKGMPMSVADAHETKGGIRIAPVELSASELGTIAKASGEPGTEAHALAYLDQINTAFTTMGLDTVQAQADYLAHALGETGLATLEEKGAEQKGYAPFIGRGPVQVTWEYGYVQSIALLEVRGQKLAAQAAAAKASGSGPDVTDPLEAQAALCQEAATAVKGDIREAANPKYSFLLSAAHMEDTGGVHASASLGSTAAFVGNGTADSWVSGGNNSQTFTDRKADADRDGNKPLSDNMQSAMDRGAVKQKVYAAAYSVLSAKKI